MKRWVIIIIVVVVAGGGFFAWRGNSGKKTSNGKYRMGLVDRGTVQTVVSATGTASAVTTVEVGSQVSGILKEIMVDFNSTVKKGQVIARIDPTFLQATVAENEASLERANASLTQAQRDLERARDLYEKNLASKADYDNALTAVDLAKASVRQAEATLQRARVNLAYSVITAPIDGVVISRDVDVGQTVAASLQAPKLFTIAQDLREMQIETNIDEADIGGLREGMDATFTVDSYPDETFKGTIKQIRYSAATDQNVVTYPVIIQVANPDLKLRPGMTANVTVVTARRDDVMRLPATALRFRPAQNTAVAGTARPTSASGQGAEKRRMKKDSTAAGSEIQNGKPPVTIYVKGKDGQPEARKIRAGLNDGSYVEVTGGELAEGDSVIVGLAGVTSTPSSNMPGVGGPVRHR